MNGGRKRGYYIIDVAKKKSRSKNRALRDSRPIKGEGANGAFKGDRGTSVGEKREDPLKKAWGDAHEAKFVEKACVPNGVEGLREVDGYQKGARVWFAKMVTIINRLSQAKDLVRSRAVTAETRLEGRKGRR